MSKVTVSQLADVLGVDSSKLLAQLNNAGIEASAGDDAVSNDDKKKLLAYLRASHGKVESDATAPRKVTLKRKTVSELRVSGQRSAGLLPARSMSRSVKAVPTSSAKSSRSKWARRCRARRGQRHCLKNPVPSGRLKRQAREEAAEQVRLKQEEEARQVAEEQARKEAEEQSRQEAEEKGPERRRTTSRGRRGAKARRRAGTKAGRRETPARKGKASKPDTRYGRKELHVAGGAAAGAASRRMRACVHASSGPTEHGFSRPTAPVTSEKSPCPKRSPWPIWPS